ncbi:ROK family protein [Sphingomonas morindae]|uniref:fructokinase n=1 Tax=Sphingomonas morindae TaxID=1541170 RepID=A0ABY4X8G0_9SPHN|nr:ROK family protein [Sphingomonas morindae]USI73125.1 ROK family protein [Sphingomonas morindae]
MTSDTSPLYGAIEAGGTKMVCGVGAARTGSRATFRTDTRAPEATVAAMIAFFREAQGRHGPLAAVGIGTFGPVDLDPASPDYGAITTTPKPGWPGTNMRRMLAEALGVPVAIDTDVNAAALAEARLGAAKGRNSVVYATIGTGVGIGIVVGGRAITGYGHPEGGHLLVRRHADHGDFAGICPYHGDCLEGLASGPAIKAAWGASLAELPEDHPAFAIEADYLGQMCASLILTVAPEHIVLGGGVMNQERLLPMIRAETLRRLAGYAALWSDPAVADARITLPGCTEPPGLLGAYLLAEQARG